MALKVGYLAPYLPFQLTGTLKAFKDKRQIELIKLGLNPGDEPIITYRFNGYEFTQWMNHFIPFLRPLSQLNSEIQHEGILFNPIDWLQDYCDCDAEREFVDHISYHLDLVDDQIGYGPYTIIQNLFKWHFDVFNLIETGIAADYSKSVKAY